MLITDIVNMIIDPVWANIFQFFVDLFHFLGVPLLGGIMAAQATIDFEKDQKSYELANMTKNSIYATNMGLIKDAVYTLFGKPYLFDATGKPYVSPNVTDVTSLPGWVSIDGGEETDDTDTTDDTTA